MSNNQINAFVNRLSESGRMLNSQNITHAQVAYSSADVLGVGGLPVLIIVSIIIIVLVGCFINSYCRGQDSNRNDTHILLQQMVSHDLV